MTRPRKNKTRTNTQASYDQSAASYLFFGSGQSTEAARRVVSSWFQFLPQFLVSSDQLMDLRLEVKSRLGRAAAACTVHVHGLRRTILNPVRKHINTSNINTTLTWCSLSRLLLLDIYSFTTLLCDKSTLHQLKNLTGKFVPLFSTWAACF